MLRGAGLLVLLFLPDPTIGQEMDTLTGHGGAVLEIAVADDGTIATGSFDNSVGIWNERSPTWLEGHDAAVTAVEFMDDGTLASAGDDFALIRWQEGEASVLGHHRGKVSDIAQAPDGTLATASWDGTIGLWTTDNPPVWLTGHASGVNAVSYMDNATLLSAGADGTLRVWDVSDGSNRIVYSHGFGINVMETASNRVLIGTVDGRTIVFEPQDWTTVAEFGTDRDPVLSLAVSPDQSRFAVGDGAGHITVMSMPDLTVEREFTATANGPVWALAFDGEGHLLAGGLDHRVFFWPLDSDPPLQLMAANAQSNVPVSNGARQFQRKCAVCHTLTNDRSRRAGPALGGLFGRRAGSMPNYPYSEILANSDIIWDAETIDALFDEGPDHYIPGSRMPMQRITGPEDREDLIAWLRDATALTEE